jgi:hypothetical protein
MLDAGVGAFPEPRISNDRSRIGDAAGIMAFQSLL